MRSVGLSGGSPVWSSQVLLLPPVVDRVGIAAVGPSQRATRVDLLVCSRRHLLDDLREKAEAVGAAGVCVLLRNGWVPVDVLVAGTTQSRAARHRSEDALAATSQSNRELPGPTDMIQRGRRIVRQDFSTAAAALGGDGVLLHGDFEVTWTSTYHLVQISATANVIARVAQGGRESRDAVISAASVAG